MEMSTDKKLAISGDSEKLDHELKTPYSIS